MRLNLGKAAEWMAGSLHGQDREFTGISTDTRSVSGGELFFGLSGPNFDGADYVADAHARGAAGAVVASLVDNELAQIKVADTRRALGALAARWRQQQPATIIGITGSNGKTTLKELVAACLAQAGPTLATAGNLNNDIGLPLMMCRIEAAHRFAVLEMGANHAGEIAYLAGLAEPAIVAITNAGSAHLEGFGSVEGVARAKGEILQAATRPRVAVLNADDRYYDFWRSLVEDVDVVSFGLADAADVRASDIDAGPGATQFRLHLHGESLDVSLPMPGLHNVRNACAAAAIAAAAGVPAAGIVAGLAAAHSVGGRLQALAGLHGATLIDDSYNANPGSVRVAGEFLATLPGERWFVLGDMFELGDDAAALHHDAGAALRAAGVSRLWALGDLSRHAVEGFGENARWFASIDDLIAELIRSLRSDTKVLVKGSRGMHMERVVDALRAAPPMRREA